MSVGDCTGSLENRGFSDLFLSAEPMLKSIYCVQSQFGCTAAIIVRNLPDAAREESVHLRMLT
jgi:hypothetical protein